MAVKSIPEGYHSITPTLCIDGADKAIEYYKKAFGAEEVLRMPGPGGKITHAELRLGDSPLIVSDVFPGMGQGQAKAAFLLYVKDCDTTFKRAKDTGGKEIAPPTDMFWGDRCATIEDPFGQRWLVATHQEDVPPAELKRRHDEWVSKNVACS